MAGVIRIKRRIGGAGPAAPTALAEGEMAFNHPATGTDTTNGALYIGGTSNVLQLVSANRQLELTGNQTVQAGSQKTINVADLKLTGGANNDILSTDGAGNLRFTGAPSGGLLTVVTDATMTGDGTSALPLSNLSLANPRQFSLQTLPGGGTTITVTPATFNGTADAIITGFEVVELDGGSY